MGGKPASWTTGSTDGAPVTICSGGGEEEAAATGGGDAWAAPETGETGEES